jgi:hypothetical protein
VKQLTTQAKIDPPVLMHRPQRLGILPTWSFWKDPAVRANPIVAKIIVPAQGGFIFTGVTVWEFLVHPMVRSAFPALGVLGRVLVSGLGGSSIGFLGACVTFGISERVLRKKILDNRRRAEAVADADTESTTVPLENGATDGGRLLP